MDAKVWGLGSNRAGQLGIGNLDPDVHVPAVPLKFSPDLNFVDVAAGGYSGLAADARGYVWTWGGNIFGQRGSGTLGRASNSADPSDGVPFRITVDAGGEVFDHVIQVVSGFTFDAALKQDGSVWVWGLSGKELYDSSGVVGTGDTNTLYVNRPTRVRFPRAIAIARIAASPDGMFALDSAGDLWSWGGGPASGINRGSSRPDFATPQRLPGLPPLAQMAIGGDGFNYALDRTGELWGWGIRGTYLGLGPAKGGWVPTPVPVKLTFPEFGGQKVMAASASAHATHVILADGSLWGWGDAAMGEVGDGTILDLSQSGYAWDWGTFERLVFRPVRIGPGAGRFKAIYSNGQAFYTYAVTDGNRVFSWGRNKTGILGNGILPTGDAGKHPDSWDVPTATQVTPLTRNPPTPVPAR